MALKDRLKQPGVVVSALIHAGALAATLVAFSSPEKLEELQETVPVEVVTDNQFNQIMKGDKAAKEVRPDAKSPTEQLASAPATPPPPPPPPTPVTEPLQDVPPTPPPPQQAAQPPDPTPPVPTPPDRPAPPQPPAEAPPVPTPPVRDVQAAEPVVPKPPPKPAPPKPAPPVPLPPVVPHPAPPKVAEVKPPPTPKPRPMEKPKPDLLAKLMDEQPPVEPAKEQPAPTPKPAPRAHKPAPQQATEDSKFDPTDISKLLNTEAPAQKPSSGQLSHLASLGSPTASAPKMSPSFWAGLDGLMEDQYRGCWSYLGLTAGNKYVPQVRVVYGPDGALQGQPVLINPPSDPSLQSLADSALRAVRRCNPLKIPEQYAPFYDQWKGRVLRFDPQEMAG